MIWLQADKASGAATAEREAEQELLALRLPVQAELSLRQLAGALGVATALTLPEASARPAFEGEASNFAEAASLLQAFLAIEDSETRARCLAYVQGASIPPARQ
ncbi:hypothetical protein J2X36_000663 [Methylobacterium sp. BE186]|uniref:hypothetical protein n=1 Tax=Methylobacterium sp. BE186 TaxID=2817715 RepID=UPI0028618053|nr:hypothetical protein [Methylobacterium sp. BE186]MDR7035927.1 hypothetical protein [Methylobacterium sp. BE186]